MRYETAELPGGITEIKVQDEAGINHDIHCYVTTWPNTCYYSTLQEAINRSVSYYEIHLAGFRKECAGKRHARNTLQELEYLSRNIRLKGEDSAYPKVWR